MKAKLTSWCLRGEDDQLVIVARDMAEAVEVYDNKPKFIKMTYKLSVHNVIPWIIPDAYAHFDIDNYGI